MKSTKLFQNIWRMPPTKKRPDASGPSLFRYAKALETLSDIGEDAKQKEVKVAKVDDFRIRAGINHVSYGADSTRLAEKFDKPINPPLPKPKSK